MTDATRTETDSLGTIEIPADKLWGPQTERARRLFRIGVERFPPVLIRAVGLQKQAAAEANLELGELPRAIAEPIIAAAAEIAANRLDEHFPLPVWQTGSGTQTNMNANEVIANRAAQMLGLVVRLSDDAAVAEDDPGRIELGLPADVDVADLEIGPL
ncbi:MAG: lyase family protein, partial [Elioraea tepidiphila]